MGLINEGDELNLSATIDDSQFKASINRMNTELAKFSGNLKFEGGEIESFAEKASSLAGKFFSFEHAKEFIESMVKVRGEFQQVEAALNTMLGSKEKSNQLMAEMVKMVATTPFTLDEVSKSGKELLTYGFAADSITGDLSKLGDIALGVSAPIADITRLYGNLKAQGGASTKDISDFSERGIPIVSELAKVLQTSEENVGNLVEAGQVGFPEVEKAFNNLTSAGGLFFNMTKDQSKTLAGQVDNLGDAWDRMLNSMGEQNEGILSSALGTATTLVDNYDTILKVLEVMIATYGAYSAAVAVASFVQVTAAEAAEGITVALKLQTLYTNFAAEATRILNVTMLNNPYVIVATAVGALIAALVVFSDQADEAAKSQEIINEITDTAAKSSIEQKEKLSDLIKVGKDETLSLAEREQALRKINDISPEFLGNLTLATLNTEAGKKAIDDYNKSVDKMALKQAFFDKRVALQKEKLSLEDGSTKPDVSFIDYAKIGFKMGPIGAFIAPEVLKAEFEKIRSKQIEDKKAQLKLLDEAETKALIKYNTENEDSGKKRPAHTKSYLDAQIISLEGDIKKLDTLDVNFYAEKAKLMKKLTGFRNEAAAFDTSNKSNKQPLGKTKAPEETKSKVVKADENKQDETDAKNLAVNLNKQKELYRAYEQYKKDFGEKAANEKFKNDIDLNNTYLNILKDSSSKLIMKGVSTRLSGKMLSVPEQESTANTVKLYQEEKKLQEDAHTALLKENMTYEEKKIALTDRYNASLLELSGDENAGKREILTKGFKGNLDALKDNALQQTDVYKKLAEETLLLTREQVVQQIDNLNKLIASGVLPPEAAAKVKEELSALKLNLNIGVDEGNLTKLKTEFALVASELTAKDKDNNSIISEASSKAIMKRLTDIQGKMSGIDKNGDGKISFGDKLAEHFKYLKGSSAEVAAGVSADLGKTSSVLGQVSASLGGNKTQAGYLLGTISELAGAASDAAGSFASFASGDVVGGITKGIGAVTKVLGIGKKVKEMNAAARKEVEDFYANAIKGEKEYQAFLAERELQTVRNNKVALVGIRDELALRKKQKADLDKETLDIMAKVQGQSYVASETYKHGTWFRKASVDKNYGSLAGLKAPQLFDLLAQGKLEGDAKALVERLKELEQQGIDADKAMADLAKETAELFTGTTSSSLTDSLAEMFASGKTSAKDLANFFKDTMDDAALNIFKNKILAGAMEKFYKEFDEAAESGDELTEEEIARLKASFDSLTGNAMTKFDEYKKITGSDLTNREADTPDPGPEKAGISGGIVAEALTEGTANRVLGITISQYDEIKMQGLSASAYYNAAISNFQVQIGIERNTFRTANNTDGLTDKLDQIITNTKGKSETTIDQKLRDAGVKA